MRGTMGRGWGVAVLAGMAFTTLAHAAPVPPTRGALGAGPGGFALGARHDGGGYDDPYEGCDGSDRAHLDVRAWNLDRELASEDNAMTVIRVRNDGPCPARNVRVTGGGADPFTDYLLTCPDLASVAGDTVCTFPTFAPGETKYFVLTATVCLFVTGEDRDSFTGAMVSSDSIDRDTGLPIDESRLAPVHFVGPYDDEACR
jgi:hypothetical protein